jgi:hypothetical protein
MPSDEGRATQATASRTSTQTKVELSRPWSGRFATLEAELFRHPPMGPVQAAEQFVKSRLEHLWEAA